MREMRIDEIEQAVSELSIVSERVLVSSNNPEGYFLKPEDFSLVDGYKGIWSQKYNRIVSVRGRKYTTVQHKEAFEPFLQALKTARANDEYHLAKVFETPKKAFMALATEFKITPNDGMPIRLGFLLKNSFDASHSLEIGGYGIRVCCMNQMVLRNAFALLRIKHTGDKEKLMQKLNSYILEIGSGADNLLQTIDRANEEAMSIEKATAILKDAAYSERSIRKIMEKYRSEVQTRWGLYNAMTAIAGTKRTNQAQLKASEQAEKILYGED